MSSLLPIDLKVFGRNLKALRETRSMSQEILGEAVNLSKGSISKYEAGSIESLDILLVVKFADALDVKPADLIGWDGSENYISAQNDGRDKMTRQSLKDDEKILLGLWGDIGDEERAFFKKQLERAAEERRRSGND